MLEEEEDERPRRAASAVLITLDTTRADALGAYGAPPGLTPALDRLALGTRILAGRTCPEPGGDHQGCTVVLVG